MAKLFVLILVFLLFAHCKNPLPKVNLVNTEEGDRDFIGKVLLKIDSLDPVVIGIDAFFQAQKSRSEDSVLVAALRKIDNDILPYDMNSQNELDESAPIF